MRNKDLLFVVFSVTKNEKQRELVKRFDLESEDARACDNHALLASCKNGHLEVAQWLGNTFGLGLTETDKTSESESECESESESECEESGCES